MPEVRFPGRRVVRCGSGGGHGVADLPPVSGDGGPRGAPHPSKVSTIIIRPPQQGHGGRRSCSTPAVARASSVFLRGVTVCGRGAGVSFPARAVFVVVGVVAASPYLGVVGGGT